VSALSNALKWLALVLMNVAFVLEAREVTRGVAWPLADPQIVVATGRLEVPEDASVGDPEYLLPGPRLVVTRWLHLEGRDTEGRYADAWRAPASRDGTIEWRARTARVGRYTFAPDEAVIHGAPALEIDPGDVRPPSPGAEASWEPREGRFVARPRDGFALASIVHTALRHGDEVTVVGRPRGDVLEPFARFPDEAPRVEVHAGAPTRAALVARARRPGGWAAACAGAAMLVLAVGGVSWGLQAALSCGALPLVAGEGVGRYAFFPALGAGFVAASAIDALVSRGAGALAIGLVFAATNGLVLAARFLPGPDAYDIDL